MGNSTIVYIRTLCWQLQPLHATMMVYISCICYKGIDNGRLVLVIQNRPLPRYFQVPRMVPSSRPSIQEVFRRTIITDAGHAS